MLKEGMKSIKKISLILFFFISFYANAKVENCFRECHFVLIGGLNNESHPNYFKDLESYLIDNNSSAISIVQPSSYLSVEDNLPILRNRLLRSYKKYKMPLVIIAHSKGGLEVINTLGRFINDFSHHIVHKVVLANTPLKGSPYMSVSLNEYRRQWGMGGMNMHPVYLNSLRVLKSLKTTEIKRTLNQSFENISYENLKNLSKRVYYFRSSKDHTLVNEGLIKSAKYLVDYGPNDGLIPVNNQKLEEFMGLPAFGTDLGVVSGFDHLDLFVSSQLLIFEKNEIFEELFISIF